MALSSYPKCTKCGSHQRLDVSDSSFVELVCFSCSKRTPVKSRHIRRVVTPEPAPVPKPEPIPVVRVKRRVGRPSLTAPKAPATQDWERDCAIACLITALRDLLEYRSVKAIVATHKAPLAARLPQESKTPDESEELMTNRSIGGVDPAPAESEDANAIVVKVEIRPKTMTELFQALAATKNQTAVQFLGDYGLASSSAVRMSRMELIYHHVLVRVIDDYDLDVIGVFRLMKAEPRFVSTKNTGSRT